MRSLVASAGTTLLALLILSACQGPDSQQEINAEVVSGGSRAKEAIAHSAKLIRGWVDKRQFERANLCDFETWGCGAITESPVCTRTKELNQPENSARKEWIVDLVRRLGGRLPEAFRTVPFRVSTKALQVARPGGPANVDARVNPDLRPGTLIIEFFYKSVLSLSNAEISALLVHELGHTQPLLSSVPLTDAERVPPHYDFDYGGEKVLNDIAACTTYDALYMSRPAGSASF